MSEARRLLAEKKAERAPLAQECEDINMRLSEIRPQLRVGIRARVRDRETYRVR